MPPAAAPPQSMPISRAGMREIVTVSELNRAVSAMLERGFPLLWVGGEISNFTRASSGHWYFTLKDAGAQVRCVMFRGRNQYAEFAPREGDRVEVRATVSLYEPRGDFQLGVESIRRAGAGDLYQAFLRLKERLSAEGLFDPDRKRPIPATPRAIGVVTSPQAAALRDVLTTLARRAPRLGVVVYPTPVQGVDAPPRIVAAIQAANARAEVDVLLVVRGGGSLEDLWAFNDERVARAIAASALPVVAGVGHETDVTIADFVADARAPTPTGAAALASPDTAAQRGRLRAAAARVEHAMRRRLERAEQQLDSAQRLLRSPTQQWSAKRQRLGALAHRLSAAMARREAHASARVGGAAARLRAPRLDVAQQRLESVSRALVRAAGGRAEAASQRFAAAAAGLELVSPRAVLSRGYAIVRDDDGRIVRAARQAPPGTSLRIELGQGALRARVTGTPLDPAAGHPADPATDSAPDATPGESS